MPKHPGNYRPEKEIRLIGVDGLRTRGMLESLIIGIASVGAAAPNAAPPLDSTFAKIKDLSAERSPELRSARSKSAQDSAGRYSAFANWLPRVELQLSQTRAKDSSFIDGFDLGPLTTVFTPQARTLKKWNLVATLPLYRRDVDIAFRGARAQASLSAVQAQIKESEHELKLRALLENFLYAIFKEISLHSSLEIARSNQREASVRFRLGQNTRIDVLRADASYAQYDSRKLLYAQQRDSTLNALLEYSGLSREELVAAGLRLEYGKEEEIGRAIDEFTRVDELLTQTANLRAEASSEKIQRTVVENNLEYRAHLADESLAARRAQMIFAQEWPELVATGTYGKQSLDWSETTRSGNNSYSLGLMLKIPLFTGGAVVSRFRESAEGRAQSRVRRELEVRKLFNDVQDQRRQTEALARSLESLKLLVSQNEEIVKLSLKSYQVGRTTFVELLGSQNDLVQAKLSVIETKIQLADLLRRYAWNLGAPTR